jgi:hypothetical protein
VGAEVAAVVSSVEEATAEVVASVKRRRVPRVVPRAVTVPPGVAVSGVEASAALLAVSAVRPAPWWS